jgi:uncharacterized membrane protein
VTNAPIALLYHRGWMEFITLNKQRPADWDSIWFWFTHMTSQHYPWHQLFDVASNVGVLNTITVILMIGVISALVWLTAVAPARPRVAQVAFLLVAAFLLVNKVFSPQYTLWLLPLAILARPRWRLFLVWQVSEVIVWALRLSLFYANDHPGKGATLTYFFMGIGLRDALLIAIMALVVRDILRPDLDVVRVSHDGLDPGAGHLDDVDPEVVDAPEMVTA